MPRPRAFDTIVLGGFTAGTLDILDAFAVSIVTGGAPIRVLQTIASGVLGRDAYQGGTGAAALGLGLHFLIAMSAATVYFLASRRLPLLVHRPIWSGLAFGLAVWVFMYYVVLPITFSRPNTIPALPLFINQLTIHAVGVGLPIALFASRSARRATTQQE